MMLSKHLVYFFPPCGRGPHWVSNSAPLPLPPHISHISAPFFEPKPSVSPVKPSNPPSFVVSTGPEMDQWFQKHGFRSLFILFAFWATLDLTVMERTVRRWTTCWQKQHSKHIITEGTAARHGRRIKCKILFFIKSPQLCTVHMSFHTSAHLHTVLSWL